MNDTTRSYVNTSELMRDFDKVVRVGNHASAHDVLSAVLADVVDSFRLAMESEGVPHDTRRTVVDTVNTYIANHYDED